MSFIYPSKVVTKPWAILLVAALLLVINTTGSAKNPDEGMWTFDNPPTKQLQERYGFTPAKEWLEHVRLSCIRFNDGGSGSFVSPNGLVMTNHHVGVGQIQKLSTPDNDLVSSGFYAKNYDKEIKCADLELNVLVGMTDVTSIIQDNLVGISDAQEALKVRRKAIVEIERLSQEKTGYVSNVITLYNGGEYWLYQYKKYTDVRLVFAPERSAAHFGGDLDNFTYPRYCLDVAFFRVYENDEPLKTVNYLKWNSEGAKKDELVFVVGNPGRTDRLYTYSQMLFERDYRFPMVLDYINTSISDLDAYSARGAEQRRQAQTAYFGLLNAKKAYDGMYAGLLDDAIMNKHKARENDLRQRVSDNPEWKNKYGDAWTMIEELLQKNGRQMVANTYRRPPRSLLFTAALNLVRYPFELEKPDHERLDGFRDSELERKKFQVLSPAPIYPELEAANFASYITMAAGHLGEDHPYVQAILKGRTPELAAEETIAASNIEDVGYRKTLMEGGKKAIETSRDPLIMLVRELDETYRANTKWDKENIKSVLLSAGEKIADARFAVFGKGTYPDANFTLRMSYGAVKGFPMNGTEAPPFTTLYGLYDRKLGFGEHNEFELPKRFWERQKSLDLATPVNLVSSNDVIGGNSGSPLINKNGQVVGLIFDGNINSLVGRFVYDEETNRSVSVHSAYIIESLRKLYDASKLANEIEGAIAKAVK